MVHLQGENSMRLVSLTCSNTEIVCALGCADLLVGVDDHSDYPEEVVATLPRVGKDLNVALHRAVQSCELSLKVCHRAPVR